MILSRWWGCRGEVFFIITHQSPERLLSEPEKAKDPTTRSSREAGKMQWLVAEQLRIFLAIDTHPKALEIRVDQRDD
jgi:hypothetical protein